MIQQEIIKLYNEQLKEWPEFATRVKGLKETETETYNFGSYEVITQYNPARAVSSNAKLDDKSIKERKCFLCRENRPAVQREVKLTDEFIALVNPFPILAKHFTIPNIQHKRQEILPYFQQMLAIARQLPEFMIFYNGPKSGASAPDHMHFQAIAKGQLPLEKEYPEVEKHILSEDKKGKMGQLQHYGRQCFYIQSSDTHAIESLFRQLYMQLQLSTHTKEEPLMNIFASYEKDSWNIFLFPRKMHRPTQFYAEGSERIMISPGAIDMAGIFVLPRKEDFEIINKEIISDVYNQVSL